MVYLFRTLLIIFICWGIYRLKKIYNLKLYRKFESRVREKLEVDDWEVKKIENARANVDLPFETEYLRFDVSHEGSAFLDTYFVKVTLKNSSGIEKIKWIHAEYNFYVEDFFIIKD